MSATRRLTAVSSHLATSQVAAEVLNEQVIVETLPKGQLEVRPATLAGASRSLGPELPSSLTRRAAHAA